MRIIEYNNKSFIEALTADKEYVSAFSDKNNYQSLFLEYMKNGGMPGIIVY